MRGIPRESAEAEAVARQNDRVGPARYVVLSVKDGWQLLIENGDVYHRWTMRGAPGNGGQAIPGIDAARPSLETAGGELEGKPAFEREGNETGHFRNMRTREGEVVSLHECLDEGQLELEFDGKLLSGRWRLTRSGMSRKEAETWTLLPLP